MHILAEFATAVLISIPVGSARGLTVRFPALVTVVAALGAQWLSRTMLRPARQYGLKIGSFEPLVQVVAQPTLYGKNVYIPPANAYHTMRLSLTLNC